MRLSLVVIVAGVFGSLVFAQEVNLRPGKYELINEFAVPEMPNIPPVKAERCVTPEEIKKLSSEGVGDLKQMGLNCKNSDYKLRGNKATFTMACQDRTWDCEMTLNGDAYSLIMRGRDKKGGAATLKSNAKRIGECTRQ